MKVALVCEEVSHFGVRLSWEKTDKSSCRVQLQKDGNCWRTIYRGFGNRHSEDTLQPDTTYRARLMLDFRSRTEDNAAGDEIDFRSRTEDNAAGVKIDFRSRTEDNAAGDEIDFRSRTEDNAAGDEIDFRLRTKADETEQHSDEIEFRTRPIPLTSENFHRAINRNNIPEVQAIIDEGLLSLECRDRNGATGLMSACQQGHFQLAELLLDSGVDINHQGETGRTALMLASYHGQLELIRLLCQRGARFDLADASGCTALHWAVDGGHPGTLRQLLDLRPSLEVCDCNGWTPLMRVCATSGNRDVGALLLESGANVHCSDRRGKTALLMAILNRHAELVEYLLNAGASLDDVNGLNMLVVAHELKNNKIVALLEEEIKKRKVNADNEANLNGRK